MARERQRQRRKPPTSNDIDDLTVELRHAGDRNALLKRVKTLAEELHTILKAEDFEIVEVTGRAAKRNLAQRLSESIAQKVADYLRPDFEGIWPDETGAGHESTSRGAGGLKKLDVNYSTHQGGLQLAVSVKTINFRDDGSNRFTKNVKRVDGELRAEASDCHTYHPYAVIAAYVFMPVEATEDGRKNSSAHHAANVLAARAGRRTNTDPPDQVELAFLGIYEDSGRVRFSRPEDVPHHGSAQTTLSFKETLEEVRVAFRTRQKKR